jgi:hypothetical protein
MSFELVPNRLNEVVPHLKATAPERCSRLADQCADDQPTIALGEFARWLGEQHDVSTLTAGVSLVDQLLGWQCSSVVEAVEDGFFACVKDNKRTGSVLIPVMSPGCRTAYESWSARDDGG